MDSYDPYTNCGGDLCPALPEKLYLIYFTSFGSDMEPFNTSLSATKSY